MFLIRTDDTVTAAEVTAGSGAETSTDAGTAIVETIATTEEADIM